VPFSAYHALVLEIAAMKRDGFGRPGPQDAPQPLPDLPQVIREAITDLHVDASTERHLVKQAWEMKRANVDDAVIAQRITEGEEVSL
jgi:hypothetical protein